MYNNNINKLPTKTMPEDLKKQIEIKNKIINLQTNYLTPNS